MTITDLYGYISEIEGGYIRAGYHPEDDNLVILNYTELATFEKRWNKYTMSARGLILDLTEAKNNGIVYILAKPFDKFPNYGTNEIEGYEDDISFNKIDYVMEKMDGSLGISYFFNDEIRFATRGSFISEQAIKATEIWKKNYAEHEDMRVYCSAPITYLVEIIYPENRVVVDYGDTEDLVLLGINYIFCQDISQITDARQDSLTWEAKRVGMKLAKFYRYDLHTMLELKKNLSANEEGFIVRFSNGKRLKIKGDEYLQVHRVMYGMSDKAKVKAWSEGNINEYIMRLPEEFRGEIEDLFEELDEIASMMRFVLTLLLRQAQEVTTTKKEFALHVNSVIRKDLRGFMFKGYEGVITMRMIKEYILKNYKDYLEVIRCKKQDL